MTSFELLPERDVERRDDHLISSSEEPWLRLETFSRRWAGRFIEVTYRASLLDEPIRPVFRFYRQDGTFVDRIAAAPILGAGIWTGRVPSHTISLSVSPTNRPGRFDFRIEGFRLRSWLHLIADGIRQKPRFAIRALALGLIGYRPESDHMLAWAIAATPMKRFASWQAARKRPFDSKTIDRPRVDEAASPTIHVIFRGGEPSALAKSFDSLAAQPFQSWRAIVVDETNAQLPQDPRFQRGHAADVTQDVNAAALSCVLVAGDVLVPEALAYVAEQARRCPPAQAFYGDVLFETDEESFEPLLLPAWGPRMQRWRPFLEPPVFIRTARLGSDAARAQFLATGLPPDDWLASIGDVKALRRMLTIKRGSPPTPQSPAPPARPTTSLAGNATIIIPTRDNPELLRRTITSIRARSRAGQFEIVIVNNDGDRDKTWSAVTALGPTHDISMIDFRGAFNFSAICNSGAAVARNEVLVFLNDDMEVLSDGWLDRLIGHALTPDIGAVGAKLTYPDGRIQHIGILVGMGESTGHFGALDEGEAAGWAGRNRVPHEVSAVTGACLAVLREKFATVGGFDAQDLPVELSDVDLCLKLNARGWQTLLDPEVHLLHEESVSRGRATFRRLSVHAREREVFVRRWLHVLRDDPFFHPGLSLYSARAELG